MTSKDGSSKPSMSSLKTGSMERGIAMARLGVGAGAKIMAHSIANVFRGEIRRDNANRDFYQK